MAWREKIDHNSARGAKIPQSRITPPVSPRFSAVALPGRGSRVLDPLEIVLGDGAIDRRLILQRVDRVEHTPGLDESAFFVPEVNLQDFPRDLGHDVLRRSPPRYIPESDNRRRITGGPPRAHHGVND